jgi:hypothetical protein
MSHQLESPQITTLSKSLPLLPPPTLLWARKGTIVIEKILSKVIWIVKAKDAKRVGKPATYLTTCH